MPKFQSGAYSLKEFATKFLTPLFADGTITEYPGAAFYAICYGELCAYGTSVDGLLAVWSAGVPDCEDDAFMLSKASYAGSWKPYENA